MTKVYEFEVLFGVETETYDLLGLVQAKDNPVPTEFRHAISALLPAQVGRGCYPAPAFSSKRVNGHPLFHWALNGLLHTIEIPAIQCEIFSLEQTGERRLAAPELLAQIEQKIRLVKGNFRQGQIVDSWRQFFATSKAEYFPIFSFRATVSSGTYIRSLAHRLGRELGCGALAFDINRTRVEEHLLGDAIHIPQRAEML